MKAMLRSLAAVVATAATLATAQAQAPSVLTTVKQRGTLNCGIGPGLTGFYQTDTKGEWGGFDVDFCRAIAAAVLDDPKKVSFKPVSAKDRLTVVQTGEVDILSRTTTWTMSRDTGQGISFAGIVIYDGQSFMLRKKLNVNSIKELSGASICTTTGTTTELNLADYFRSRGLKYESVLFEKTDDALAAYTSGRCDAYTTDRNGLFSERLRLPDPDNHIILPEMISKEPLSPAVRSGDMQWFNIVRWTVAALINAEELGITKANVDEMLKSQNPEIRRFLGVDGNLGKGLDLTNDWAVRIIKAVGNYGEMFERNLGKDSPLKISRSLNNLWTNGGLMYGLPMR